MVLLTQTKCAHELPIRFLAAQPGVGTRDSDGLLGCSFHSGFAVLGGDTASNLSTVRFVAHQQHFRLLDLVDQELAEAAGQHVLCFLVAPVTDVEIGRAHV